MQQSEHVKYIIVGAGLSGLTTAYKLWQAGFDDFLILEARKRIGGRIRTKRGVDLGATWFQNYHQALNSLLAELEISQFHQKTDGKSILVHNSDAPPYYFQNDPNATPSGRIQGGSFALIEKLAAHFKAKIKCSTRVNSITEQACQLLITTNNKSYTCTKIISTLPPALVTNIRFKPELPKNLTKVFNNTHTWMSNAIKVGIAFKAPFWRTQDLSGMLVGQTGPVIELYDHANSEENKHYLMGFLNENLRNIENDNRKEIVLNYLAKYFGKAIFNHTDYMEKDWSKDKNTSNGNLKSVHHHNGYGDPIFNAIYNNNLIFSGAETASSYGGYMEGAVLAGINAAQLIIKNS